ncbi:hypothetical protein OBBRIDRAFT_792728 [Obba rivulosa]|uniref:Uncharacterized protein n=1 Tax=Obba rivulosa TaxID=1052685 RepID=A0A8E2AU54_9APHY|nr:hypothetical protein OBBRIDRAFT_792728 [Obba rivulosa]
MDAVDVNWCLVCDRHIDRASNGAYCSRECLAHDKNKPSTSASPLRPVDIYPPVESISELDELDDDGDSVDYIESRYDHAPTYSVAHWIGRGDAGIRAWALDVVPGAPSKPSKGSTAALKPPKLLRAQRPISPSLYMCTTSPALSETSLPTLTSQQSLPCLSMDHSHADADRTSIPTAPSSVSLATPASEAGSAFLPPPTARPHKTSFMSHLATQFKSWAASNSHSDYPPRTTRPTAPSVTQSTESARFPAPLTTRQRRSHSPIRILPLNADYTGMKGASSTYMDEKEGAPLDMLSVRDVYVSPRGRSDSRAAS